MLLKSITAISCLITLFSMTPSQSPASEWRVGTAKEVITPDEPMWMSGYGSRNRPADGKISDLWAKVMTIEDHQGTRIILVTLDLIGIDAATTDAIKNEAARHTGVSVDQIAISTTHTHSGPVVGTNLLSMYDLDYSSLRQIDRYTQKLKKTIVRLIQQAGENLSGAEIHWTVGRCKFAVNRRNNREQQVPELTRQDALAGPVDHDVPILVVTEPVPTLSGSKQAEGLDAENIRAIVCGYACHATVLSGYQWCADWPGYAQSDLESRFPNADAMVWVGCGADQNPIPRRSIELAQAYGRQLGDSVAAAILKPMNPIDGEIKTSKEHVDLEYQQIPTREELQQTSQSSNRFEASRAKQLLNQLNDSGSLPESYPYPVQSWKLGDGPLWYFLGGEVVVDYALRLKEELGAGSTWVTAYANDVMAYIPSERVLSEGGYEGGGSMVYYGLPSPWKTGIEAKILSQARSQAHRYRGTDKPRLGTLTATEYPDHNDLSSWSDSKGNLQPIQSPENWKVRRGHILESMQMVMGRLPQEDQLAPLRIETLETQSFKDYERRTISYTVDSFSNATADLYLPHSIAEHGSDELPAVLALHPTSPLGKRIVAGEGPRPNRNYGDELARRGYVVLAPDYPSFGDQKNYNFATDSYVSGSMKAIANHRRGIDVLTQIPEVDPTRIGAIGHSLGGHNAIFLGAFDERIQCVVSSCGWDPFPYYYGGRLAGWASERYMPRIRELFGLKPQNMPFDLTEAIAAIAPRAFFSCSPLKDSNFDAEGVKKVEPQIRSVYTIFEAESQFVIRYPDAEHDFPTPVRHEAYEFLDHALGNSSDQ